MKEYTEPFTESDMPKLKPLPVRSRFWPHKPLWKLAEDWQCCGFLVPKGFVTDLDSVTRIPFIYGMFKGRIRATAVLHDFHYTTGCVSRKEADDFLRMNAVREGNSKNMAKLLHKGVDLAGWMFYKK